MQKATVDEVAAIVRFANRTGTLPKARRKALTQQWEKRAANAGAPRNDGLHLAVLLATPGGTKPGDATRARELLVEYLEDAQGKPQALLDFARFQLMWLDERERWLKAARRERRARVGLEKKLEALKAIERRMSDQSSHDKVPIR